MHFDLQLWMQAKCMFRPFATMLRTSLTFNFDYIAINGVSKTPQEVNTSLEEGVFEVLF
jgi:hypothetical protein